MDDTIRRLTSSIGVMADAYEAVGIRFNFLPAVGSQAASESAADAGFTGTPSATAVTGGSTKTAAMLDYALGVAAIIETPRRAVLSVIPLAGAVLELGTGSWWMLDPTIDRATRIGRSLQDRLRGLEQRQRVCVGPESSSEQTAHLGDIASHINDLLLQADALGVPVRRNKKKELIGFGEPPLDGGIATQVGLFLEEATDDPHLGRSFYADFCSTTHGNIYGVTQYFKGFSGRPVQTGHLEMPSEVTVSILALCIGAIRCAVFRQFDLFGWPRADFASRLSPVRDALRAATDFTA